MYTILSKFSPRIQVVSCDEALIDVGGNGDPLEISQKIRAEIFRTTGCPCSVGIGWAQIKNFVCLNFWTGENILLAKLACRKAKPDGIYHLKKENVANFF